MDPLFWQICAVDKIAGCCEEFFLGPVGIKLNDRESVQISKLVIKTDESALMQPRSIKAKTASTRVPQILFMT